MKTEDDKPGGMMEHISDFDRGALAVIQLSYDLRRQVLDFRRELRDAWGSEAISEAVECWGLSDQGSTGVLQIDLWVELVVDGERYVLWSFEITYSDGSWQIEWNVQLNEIGSDYEGTIIGSDSATYGSFEQLLPDAPDTLAALFATRAQVERIVVQKSG